MTAGRVRTVPGLLSPLAVGARTARNRVLHAPMSVCYADHDGYVTQEEIAHYGRRAQGGAGMIVTENFAVSESGRQLPRQTMLGDEKYLPGLSRLAAEVRGHGALAVAQIFHAGRYAGPWEQYEARRRLAPSPVPFPLVGDRVVTPDEITPTEIAQVVGEFAAAAALLAEAGFDGVDIHGAQGFLVSSFLSPRMNRRKDGYGGDFDRRVRMPLEVVAAVRDRVPADFLVGFHLMSTEAMPGGWTLADAVRLAPRLERAGIDFIVPVPTTFESLREPANAGYLNRERFQVPDAAAVKAAVGIPVVANGRLGNPADAEQVLAAGEADAIGLARPLFVDPDWVAKVSSGRAEQLRTCGCDPPTCLRTQLTGGVCHSWPPAAQAEGHLGYSH